MAQQDDAGHDEDDSLVSAPNPPANPPPSYSPVAAAPAPAPAPAPALALAGPLPPPPVVAAPPRPTAGPLPPPPRQLSLPGSPASSKPVSPPTSRPGQLSVGTATAAAPIHLARIPSSSSSNTSSPSILATAVSSVVNGSPIATAGPGSNFQQNGDGGASSSSKEMSHHHPGGPSHHHHQQHQQHQHQQHQQHQHQHQHQHVAYSPSSAAYPQSTPYSHTTAVPSTQYGAYPSSSAVATTQPSDGFRGSPITSSPMALPSMRTIGSMPPQPAGHHPAPHSIPMTMSLPMAPISTSLPFYSHHSMVPSPTYGLPPDMARYALPHNPHMGNRGPKKEIKRRTKTGCLTCRKRRIKCDETHPTCNNCKKSKRECLGYDPIFRQQPGSQSSTSSVNADSPNATPTQSVPSLPSSATPPASATVPLPPVAPGSAPAPRPGSIYGGQQAPVSSGYGSSPDAIPTPTPTPTSASTGISYDSFLSPVSAHQPVKVESGYEHHPHTIDPTLRTLPSTSIQDGSRAFDSKSFPGHNFHLRAKKMKIDEIIDLLGPRPPAHQISQTEETYNEVTKVYHEMYAAGLSNFFETTWYYFVEDQKMSFPRDANLVEHMASFLKILEAVKVNDHAQMAYSGVLETRLVWELASTARHAPRQPPSADRTVLLPYEGDPNEASCRLQVVEALLCGDYLPHNPLAPPVQNADTHRVRQFDFWYSLAEFVRKRDAPDTPEVVKAREDILSRMRYLLDGRENRDVLYSIAVVRELAPRFDPAYGNTIPPLLDETDPKNRLAVASKFIMDESQVTGGTTNVVRRFSDIASRAFVNPGVNVARRI